jgi:hypothetical protein
LHDRAIQNQLNENSLSIERRDNISINKNKNNKENPFEKKHLISMINQQNDDIK